MIVKLLNYTPLYIADKAIGKCWDKPTPDEVITKHATLGDITKPGCNTARIERVALKNKHASTIEHLNYTFDIDGVSRALLQELARHRIASYSVKSTRYTLKELKDEASFFNPVDDFEEGISYREMIELEYDFKRAEKYVVFTKVFDIDFGIVKALDTLRYLVASGLSNDKVKYSIPEAYKTSLVWTINARSLQNFLALRSSKDALWEIRELAMEIYNKLPDDHKFLFKDFIKDTK